MNEPFIYEEEIEEEQAQPRSMFWRVMYAFVVILLIIIFLLNLTGLSHWLRIGRFSYRNLSGETEVSIIDRFGEPDYRSAVQPFVSGEGFGMMPQRLDEGDEFYFLNFVIGPRLVVFHFVSPETYTKHTKQLVLGDEWVVLEYYSGSRYVVY